MIDLHYNFYIVIGTSGNTLPQGSRRLAGSFVQ